MEWEKSQPESFSYLGLSSISENLQSAIAEDRWIIHTDESVIGHSPSRNTKVVESTNDKFLKKGWFEWRTKAREIVFEETKKRTMTILIVLNKTSDVPIEPESVFL